MEEGRTSPTFAQVLAREQVRLARQGWQWLVVYVAVTTAAFGIAEYQYGYVTWLDLWVSIFAWAAGYLLLIMLMERANLPMQAGIGSYLAVGCVTGLAIMIGLAAFILPGVYLTLRWLPVYVRCLATEDWIGDSIRWSWNGTEPFQKELAIALCGPVGIILAALGVVAVYETYLVVTDTGYFASAVLINLATGVAYAWLTLLGVAAYLAISQAAIADTPEQATQSPA